VVKEVVQTSQVFSGRHIDALPDLLVIWENKAPVTHVTSSRVGEILKDFPERRTGAHRPWGFFAAAGPHINHDAVLEKIHLLDLAPTILNALGVRPPAHLKGRTLFEMSIDKTHP
jgi:predicted AlkP superfamily phosphohydrolase/phosphomutase